MSLQMKSIFLCAFLFKRTVLTILSAKGLAKVIFDNCLSLHLSLFCVSYNFVSTIGS